MGKVGRMTPQQARTLTKLVAHLVDEAVGGRISPEQARLRFAHKLAEMRLLELPSLRARRLPT